MKLFGYRLLSKLLLFAFVFNSFSVVSLAIGIDTDSDGMADDDEAIYGYITTDSDQDLNGIIDGVDDFDSDGISNADEIYTTFTNPDAWDTDADERNDGMEITEGTDPNVSELPDLALMAFELDSSDNSVLITVQNVGDYGIVAFDTEVELYAEGVLVDTFSLNDYGTDYRDIMGSATFNSSYILDGTQVGVEMTIILDSGEDVVESDEENTTTTMIRFEVPDLNISDISVNADNEVVYTVKNEGGQSIDASLAGENRITVDGVDNFDYWADMTDLSWLAADAFTTEPAVDVTSSIVLSGGYHIVEVCLDTSDLVSEFGESNNCIQEEFTLGLPDLVITSVTLNSDNTLHFVIENQGTADMDSSLAPELHFYDQTNGDGSADEIFLLNDLGTSYQAVGGTMEFNSLYTVPSSSVTILAVVDALGDVEELTESTFEANYYRATLSLTAEESGGSEGSVESDACEDDGSDNTESGATALTATSTVEGSICVEDNDFYTFTVEDGDSVQIAITYNYDSESEYADGNSDINAIVSHESFGTTDDLDDEDADEALEFLVDTETVYGPGVYYIEIYEYLFENSNDYTLSFTLTGVPEETVETPVETPVETTPSTGGGSSGGGGGRRNNDEVTFASEDDNSIESSVEGSEDVELTEEEISACGTMTFADVLENNENYDAIYALWCEGVIHGKDSTHFAPNDFIMRDEAAKVAGRLFGFVTMDHSELPTLTSTSYSDVSLAEPLAFYIETLTEESLFDDELADGKFRPHENMMYSEIVDLLEEASDEEVSMSGYLPSESVTRGDFVTLILSLFE